MKCIMKRSDRMREFRVIMAIAMSSGGWWPKNV